MLWCPCPWLIALIYFSSCGTQTTQMINPSPPSVVAWNSTTHSFTSAVLCNFLFTCPHAVSCLKCSVVLVINRKTWSVDSRLFAPASKSTFCGFSFFLEEIAAPLQGKQSAAYLFVCLGRSTRRPQQSKEGFFLPHSYLYQTHRPRLERNKGGEHETMKRPSVRLVWVMTFAVKGPDSLGLQTAKTLRQFSNTRSVRLRNLPQLSLHCTEVM